MVGAVARGACARVRAAIEVGAVARRARRLGRAGVVALALALAVGCGGATSGGRTAGADRAPRGGSPALAAPATTPRPPVWIEDDVPSARAAAIASGKILLVDAWAPWCHTCLSMKEEVLEHPDLGVYADRVVFAAADTDRPVNAELLARYAVEVWPTFFLIDPAKDRVLAVHGGAASLDELRRVVDGALALRASGAAGAFESELASAAEAYAARRFAEAASLYERAAARQHPRTSEALIGAVRSIARTDDVDGCARIAEAGIDRVHGSAMAADFAYYARSCAAKLPAGGRRFALEHRARERLRALTADPPAGATVDDRADVLGMLAAAEREAGDEAAARAANEARVKLLEEAAGGAQTPEDAATFDYLRVLAYRDAGRPEEAVRMLEERTRQLPGSYEAHARLAAVLAVSDPARALAPLRRAIELSYGPRRTRYMEQEVELLGRVGDAPGRVHALRRLVEALRALPPGHADPPRLAQAEKRLAEALAAPAAPAAPSERR